MSDEFIRFEITDDDLDNEFNPNRSRKAKKEHQIYGVWAKDSDDEENEDNIRQKTRTRNKDYSAPIGFVAGGVEQAGKKNEKGKNKELKSSEPEPSVSQARFTQDSSDEEQPVAPDEKDTAGIRKVGQGMKGVNLGGNVGHWERHTKGIGAKLLLQMGYKPGMGLGKTLQGISAPVEATVRKGRGAIGAYGPEKAAQKAKREAELKEKDSEVNEKEKTYNWKKSHKGRYFYRDANDVIQEGKPSLHTISSSELSRVPVIDMTGKERRVLSGYHALRATAPRFEHEPRRKLENFVAPQLLHNLEVMVDSCEQDIIQNARELRTAEDEIVVLQRDLDECNKKLQEHDVVIDTVEHIASRVAVLTQDDVSLETAYEVLADLKKTYPLEYEMFELGPLAGKIVSPFISAMLAKWDPLQNPEEPLPVFLKWRELLSEEAYNSLLWQHFIPHISTAAEAWNPRSPAGMLRVVGAWAAATPAWAASCVLARAVLPRLLAAVRGWDPTHDTQPLHQWLLPWHDLAGSALSVSVYPLVRSRLAAALAAWHPADGSARPLLAAWRAAWGPALAPLLQHHVLPKLEHCLQHSPISLVGPPNSAWVWCVEWLELVGGAALGALAGRALLPRWLAALAAWLNTNPPHHTVLTSYTNFKDTFPEEVAREPVVRDAFRKALDMMNRSTDIDMVEPPPPPSLKTEPNYYRNNSQTTTNISDVLTSSSTANSFSELLESKCVEKGITFVPIVGKTREGRPLYKIGDMQCYVIRNVIMYSEDSGRTFMPIGLDRLLSKVED